MFGQSENGLLLIEVPQHDVGVLAALTASKQLSIVGDGQASNLVVVRCQEVLVVGVLQVAHHD